MNVQIVKGSVNLSEKAKGISIQSQIQQNTEMDQNNDTVSVDYIAVNAYNSAVTNRLSIDAAASIIVGRIRVKFVEGIRRHPENEPQEFDIASLRYMDDILFNDLEYLIKSVIRFGSNGACIKINQCMRMIRDAANLIYYKINNTTYNEIEAILKVVYNE